MSKFNTKVTPETVTSYEGAVQYKKDTLSNWFQFLFASYLEDKFYEDAATQMNRFQKLTNRVIDDYGAAFAAKAAMFARNELGTRSASEFVAAMLNAEGFNGKRDFYKNYYHRADGPQEVFAAIDMLGDKRSHALVRGTADYLSTLGDYQLTKYHGSSHKFNMFDMINLTHANSDAITRYKKGESVKADTWENSVNARQTQEQNDEEWIRLVLEGKMGYLALVRNLNNIMDAANRKLSNPAAFIETSLISQLKDKVKIRKSLVFPYQIYTAYKNLEVKNLSVISALSEAFCTATSNMPQLDGKSCVILDVSGSMDSCISAKSNMSIKEVGACYAAALYLQGNTDFVKFGNEALVKKYNRLNMVFSIIEDMCKNDNCGYGTDITAAFSKLNKKYDRLFIISDMQTMGRSWSWGYGERYGVTTFNEYAVKYNPNCFVYSFDLAAYDNSAVNTNNPRVIELTSLTDKLFKMIPFLENGDNLADYINRNYSF